MDYKLSVAVHKIKKQYGMAQPEYVAYADLRAAGWSMTDAWLVAFNGQGLQWSKATLQSEMNKLENLESVQSRIKFLKEGRKNAAKDGISSEDLAKETSKEKILTDLVLARKNQKPGSKEWNDLTKMIADYNKIKQDEIPTEDTTVHFFLPERFPVSCADCPLKAAKKKKTEE